MKIVLVLANTVDLKGDIYLDLLSLPESLEHGATGFISGLNMGLNFGMLENIKAYVVVLRLFFVCFFFKISVFKILLQRTVRVATRFDPDLTRQNVGPNLSPIYLQI